MWIQNNCKNIYEQGTPERWRSFTLPQDWPAPGIAK